MFNMRFAIKEEKINEHPSGFCGSAALPALQNDHTFILDLLVRESIQNSSDAATEGASVYHVFYNTGTYDNKNLTRYFDKDTEKKLNDRYPSTCSFLEIRDKNTVGLTGETVLSKRNNSTKSNFMRLIFDMGKGQDEINAGGKWGYGKTVYYRLGNGIVIYYSRVKTEGEKFESRLMLTLIENETKEDAILKKPEDTSAGRAWWGKKIGDDICPITDDSTIANFLKIFSLEPFEEGETGTAIIIPYINETALIEEAKSGFKADSSLIERCTFLNSVPSYLKYAIQKWYAPIINNFGLRKYGRKFLNAYVNGDDEMIKKEDMYPIFKLVQELYTTAYAKLVNQQYNSTYPIVCKESEGSFRQHPYKLGYVAFSKMQLKDLQGEELLLPPNVYMNVSDNDYNGSVTLYTRDLGMVLNYDETWVSTKEFSVPPDELLITFFVPNTSTEINFGGESVNLGAYLRVREEADHMKWDDDPAIMKVKCVKQIKSSVDTAVRKHFNPESFEVYAESDLSEFAGLLGEKLFPRKKNTPKSPGPGSGSEPGRIEKSFAFFASNSQITPGGQIKISYELELKEKTAVIIKTKVSSAVAVDAGKWKEKIGTTYPLKVKNLIIDTKEAETEIEIREENCEVIVSGEKNKISGTFEIEASDRELVFVIDCEEKRKEDNK